MINIRVENGLNVIGQDTCDITYCVNKCGELVCTGCRAVIAYRAMAGHHVVYTDEKENKIFLIYREIQSGAVAKSYMTNGLLIYGEIFSHILIY